MLWPLVEYLLFWILTMPLESLQTKGRIDSSGEEEGIVKKKFEDDGEVLYQIVASLNWTSINFYTDNVTEGRGEVMNMLTKDGTFVINIVSRLDSETFQSLSCRGLLSEDMGRIHVVFCRLECFRHITYLVREATSERFLFTSKWLVMTDGKPSVMITEKLEHVAFIRQKSAGKSGTLFWPEEMMTLDTKFGERRLLPVHRGPVTGPVCPHETKLEKFDRSTVFPNLNHGLNGRTLRIGVDEWYPYLLKQRLDNGTEVFRGLAVDILKELGNILNFRNLMSLHGCPLMHSEDRKEYMDFTYPVGFNKILAYYKRPKEADRRWRLVVDILSWPVIVITFLSLLFTASVLGTFHTFNNDGKKLPAEATDRNLIVIVRDMVWLLMGSLLKQGQYIGHQSTMSVRMVFAAWSVFCIILTVTFTAYLVPALGVNKWPVLFNNLRDLINHGGYKWGMYGDQNWILKYLPVSKVDDHRELYNKLIEFNQTDSEVLSEQVEVHERKVLTENYVYIMTPLKCSMLITVMLSSSMANYMLHQSDLFCRKIHRSQI